MLSAGNSVLWIAGHGVRSKSCRGKSEGATIKAELVAARAQAMSIKPELG